MRLSNGIVQLQLADMSMVFVAESLPTHHFYVSKHGEEAAYPTDDLGAIKDRHVLQRLKRFDSYYRKLSRERRSVP